MRLVTMFFMLLAGAALQSFFPVVAWLGYANVPVLCSIVVYYTLYRGGATMLAVALLAGLFQDSMSLIPLGYSSFVFAVLALIVEKYRELMVLPSPLTHMVVTAVVHGVATAVLSVLLLRSGMIHGQPWWLLLKIPGAVLLGLVTGPLVIGLMQALEEKLGLIQGNSDQYGAQRSFYGIG
jgi:cell shape-determining protein MreD